MQAKIFWCATCLLLSNLLVNNPAFAQKNYVEGFVIDNSGDTIRGYLNFKGETRNSESCNFRSTKEGDEITYMPGDITGYKFDPGEFYLSKKFEIDGSERSVFAEVLFAGIYNLYYYRKDRQLHYFIENSEGKVWELKNEKILYRMGGKEHSKMSKEYIATLKVLFADNLAMQPEIEQSERTHKELITLAKDYHEYTCPDITCVVYEEEANKVRYRFGGSAGFASNTVEIGGFPHDDFNFNYSFTPQVGLFFNTSVPRFNHKISIEVSTRLSRHYLASTYSRGSEYKQHHDLYLDYLQLLSNFSIKYTYPKGKFRPYVAIGISLMGNLNQETRYLNETESFFVIRSYEYNDQVLPNSMLGGIFELGMVARIKERSRWFINAYYGSNGGSYASTDGVERKTTVKGFGLSAGLFF